MDDLLNASLAHIKKLLKNNTIQPLKGKLAKIPDLVEIHEEIKKIREGLSNYSSTHEDYLSSLIIKLRDEFEHREIAMEVMQESESRFKYLADHDSLTGAMNRRSFMERAIQEIHEAFRHDITCGVIMLDIDFFKKFNDTYGHQAGDEALRHLVRTITSLSRTHDFLGRYGGEEFIYFFSYASKDTSIKLAERIRKSIECNPVKLEAGHITITVSLGIALIKKPKTFKKHRIDESRDLLETQIHSADLALYHAKKTGRNRAVFYTEKIKTLSADK